MSIALTPRKASVGLSVVAVGFMLSAASAESAFAWLTANHASSVFVAGYAIPTDAALKSALSILCGFALVFGPTIIAHKWRTDAKVHIRAGWALAGAVALAFTSATVNFAGYFAHNRYEAGLAALHSNPEYKAAMQEITTGTDYFAKKDAREWIEAHQPSKDPEFWDFARSAFVHLMVMVFASSGYVAEPQTRQNVEGKRGRGRIEGRKKGPRPTPRKPVLVAAN